MEERSAGDFSQLRVLSSQLNASKASLRSMIERSPDAYLVVDHRGSIQLVNPAAVRMFGLEGRRLIGQSFGFPLTAGETTEIDIVNPQAGGLIAEMRVVEIDWDGTEVYVAVLRDITERKAAEAEIRRLNAELEQRVRDRTVELERSKEALLASNLELERFAHAAAHDLQAPLRSILGFAQLVQQALREGRGEHVDEWLGHVIDSTRRLQNLIRDLLAYARLGADAGSFRAVDLRQVVQEVRSSLAALLDGSEAEVACGDLPTVTADPTQIGQLLQNLIENGIKYNRTKPPRVSVSARRQVGEWVIMVADNGVGIAAKDHDRIFEIFRRLHGQNEVPGTGIGLAICHRIVQRHGGRIWVESEPGRGSVFCFTLPDRSLETS